MHPRNFTIHFFLFLILIQSCSPRAGTVEVKINKTEYTPVNQKDGGKRHALHLQLSNQGEISTWLIIPLDISSKISSATINSASPHDYRIFDYTIHNSFVAVSFLAENHTQSFIAIGLSRETSIEHFYFEIRGSTSTLPSNAEVFQCSDILINGEIGISKWAPYNLLNSGSIVVEKEIVDQSLEGAVNTEFREGFDLEDYKSTKINTIKLVGEKKINIPIN